MYNLVHVSSDQHRQKEAKYPHLMRLEIATSGESDERFVRIIIIRAHMVRHQPLCLCVEPPGEQAMYFLSQAFDDHTPALKLKVLLPIDHKPLYQNGNVLGSSFRNPCLCAPDDWLCQCSCSRRMIDQDQINKYDYFGLD